MTTSFSLIVIEEIDSDVKICSVVRISSSSIPAISHTTFPNAWTDTAISVWLVDLQLIPLTRSTAKCVEELLATEDYIWMQLVCDFRGACLIRYNYVLLLLSPTNENRVSFGQDFGLLPPLWPSWKLTLIQNAGLRLSTHLECSWVNLLHWSAYLGSTLQNHLHLMFLTTAFYLTVSKLYSSFFCQETVQFFLLCRKKSYKPNLTMAVRSCSIKITLISSLLHW